MSGRTYEIDLNQESARGPRWPLDVWVCQTCGRPTLFAEDRCCSGFMMLVPVLPVRDLGFELDEDDALVEELELSTRAYNCLKRADIQTVNQLCLRSPGWLSSIPSFGAGCLAEVEQALADRDLKLCPENWEKS